MDEEEQPAKPISSLLLWALAQADGAVTRDAVPRPRGVSRAPADDRTSRGRQRRTFWSTRAYMSVPEIVARLLAVLSSLHGDRVF